jgi:predicted DNA-binding transcriptional regulator AlpA
MSSAPWKTRACRLPKIHSSAIALHQADGLDAWYSTADILGSPHYGIPAMFDISRDQLEAAIAEGIFPQPYRVKGSGPRGPLIWPSSAIKAYVEDCEAEQEAKAKAAASKRIPEGYSTTADLVKLLRVSRQTLHNYYGRKIPRPQRFNGKPAWSREQVHQILVAMGEEEE